MDVRIENVIDLMKKKLEAIDDIKFYKHLNGNAKILGKTDTSLNQRTLRLWDEIVTGRGYFNTISEIKNLKKLIKKEDILIFFNSVFNKHLSKLSIQVNCTYNQRSSQQKRKILRRRLN